MRPEDEPHVQSSTPPDALKYKATAEGFPRVHSQAFAEQRNVRQSVGHLHGAFTTSKNGTDATKYYYPSSLAIASRTLSLRRL